MCWGMPPPEAVPAGQVFRELGFDSLTAVELRDRLGAVTGLRLPATLVFDYPTPVVLASWLRGELTGAVPGAAGGGAGGAGGVRGTGRDRGDELPVPRRGGHPRSSCGSWSLSGTDAVSVFPADRGWDGAAGGCGAGGRVRV